MLRTQSLRVFVTVADCGNIRDAAKSLGRTVSAISMTLKQLESHLGAPLFETDRKHTLTALGHEVRKLANDLLREHDRTTERIAAIAAGREGALRIAAVPSVAAQLLPPILTDMLVDHPGIRIELLDTDSASVHMLVETGEVELGIGGKPEPRAGLQFVPLFNDPFRLVCNKNHPLAHATSPLTRADLQGHRLISNKSTIGFPDFRNGNPDVASTLSARNVISLLALVRAGAGATILPALATLSINDDLCSLALDDPTALRTVGFILRQNGNPSPICAAFQNRFLDLIQKAGTTPATEPGLPVIWPDNLT
ncbi:LysR family transcriptional regulator [Aquicoccus porphyridii]|uniref:LysR family transcriptional regulator n=1 Tax=Aquicoccus porphyridii TaxID=1852029 RepID=A0A5A9YYG2_9RHOB|nr:LysR family transcriptional regulator [Aquicoccus porphyridii]KAA0909904.1 LysR family transcriptional regulator [Aquicoccus porphyridii]RAI52827.1 LysR family transcriptional regulator [Rhodobacteraceae bacterium AsT-22]